MNPTKIDSIDYNGYIVELHYNPILKCKPYLVRVFSWHNDPYEIRADRVELASFSTIINKLIEDNE
jgi:hypothetical protein